MQSPAPELKSIVVRAGAGAGKTTRLVAQVIDVANTIKGQTGFYPKLVLTTFTKKATQELRERLMLKAVELGDQQLLDYLNSSSIHISTIHGVLAVFLKRYGHLAGLDNAYSMISGSETHTLAKAQLRKLCEADESLSELIELLGYQRLTKILIGLADIKATSSAIAAPSEIDLSEYSKSYWKQFEAKYKKPLQTIHDGTDSEKYQDYIRAVMSVMMDLTSEQAAPSLDVLKSRIPSKPRFNKKNPVLSEEADAELKSIVDTLKKSLDRPELNPDSWAVFVRHYKALSKGLDRFSQAWVHEKLELALLDSNDLETMSFRILHRHPELGDAFSEDFDYWLVDEYQDTSPVQVELLKSLSGGRPQFIVGDPQQSIYLFRGSDSRVFQSKQMQMQKGAGQFETLETNWRSRPELLEFFNHLFTKMSSSFQTMKPKAEPHKGASPVATFAVTLKSDADEDPDQQYHSIAKYIEQAIEDGARYEDICILARTNSQLKLIAKYLKAHGFPTHLHASGGFFDRREIVDSLSLLKFLVNPFDNKNLITLLRSPWVRVSDDLLAHWLKGMKSAYWPQIKDKTEPAIEKLSALLNQLSDTSLLQVFEEALVRSGLLEFSRKMDPTGRRESNIWKLIHLLHEEERAPGFSYLKFIGGLSRNEEGESLDGESDAIASLEPNHVQLMTVHASKGLQFEHVVLPHLDKAPLPPRTPAVTCSEDRKIWSVALPLGENDESFGTPIDFLEKERRKSRELEESLRVFYVAATRAKQSIFMSMQGLTHKPNSWAAKLPWELAQPGDFSEEHFSYEVWHSPYQRVDRTTQKVEAVEVRPKFQQSSDRKQSLDQVSVTKLVEEQVQAEVSSKPSAASELPKSLLPKIYQKTADGVYFHRVMEGLRYDPDFDYKSMARAWFAADSEKVCKAVEWTKSLEQPPMLQLLKSGHVEYGFQFLKDSQIIEGQIDLWGIDTNNHLWIVDYKTGKSSESEKALKQLRIYKEALQKAGHDQQISLVVLFPIDQKTIIEN